MRRSGKCNSHDCTLFYRKPWGTSPELHSVCTPSLCRNLYLASVPSYNSASTTHGTFELGPFDKKKDSELQSTALTEYTQLAQTLM